MKRDVQKDAEPVRFTGSHKLTEEQQQYMLERFGERYVRVQTGDPLRGNRAQRRDAGWR